MSIVSCPRCGDKVSLPPSASPSALVQCPLCCEEYYLSDALIQLPPMLIVVGSHAAPADQESDYRLAEPVAAAVSEGSLDAGIGTVTPSRPQLRTVARPRRPEKSAVGEIVKVVLGGAAGLAGGLLVLWWVFGVDVGELGTKISQVDYLRFLVPQKLWDQSVRSEKDAAEFEPLAADKQVPGNARKKSGGENQPDDAASAGSAAKSTGQDQGAAQSDPFLTLDDVGSSAPSSNGAAGDLKLDDPLSALSPSESAPARSKNEEPSATETSPKDKAKNPPPADAAEEKPEEKPAEKAAEKPEEPSPSAPKQNDDAEPSAEKGPDRETDADSP